MTFVETPCILQVQMRASGKQTGEHIPDPSAELPTAGRAGVIVYYTGGAETKCISLFAKSKTEIGIPEVVRERLRVKTAHPAEQLGAKKDTHPPAPLRFLRSQRDPLQLALDHPQPFPWVHDSASEKNTLPSRVNDPCTGCESVIVLKAFRKPGQKIGSNRVVIVQEADLFCPEGQGMTDPEIDGTTPPEISISLNSCYLREVLPEPLRRRIRAAVIHDNDAILGIFDPLKVVQALYGSLHSVVNRDHNKNHVRF